MRFRRAEHQLVAEILRSMHRDILLATHCYFGGGTAIVLKHGEYRTSLDLDFMVADTAGYRDLRSLLTGTKAVSLFSGSVRILREPLADAYGIRMLLGLGDRSFKFEVVREARISLDGALDEDLGIPLLSVTDLFAEKLLANADRCFDKAVAYRDAMDLGIMVQHHRGIPVSALGKASEAYGVDIARKMAGVLNLLRDTELIRQAAHVLSMEPATALDAIEALRTEAMKIWPEADIRAMDQ